LIRIDNACIEIVHILNKAGKRREKEEIMKRNFKKLEKYEDWLVALFYFLVTVVYAVQIPSIKRTSISPINSAFLPIILSAGMGILTVCQIWNAVKKQKAAKATDAAEETAEAVDGPEYGRAMLTLAASLLYVALLKPLGFMISSILYLELQMCIMADKERRKPVKFLIISVVSVVVIYFVFHNLLQLMLPNGILTGII